MKNTLAFLVLILFVHIPVHSQKLNKDLIGEWEFFRLEDFQGNKIDTIRNRNSYEIPSAPYTIYKEDGTYSKKFTAFNIENVDSGTWTFKKKTNEIHLKLIYKKPYGVGQKFLIDNGHAKQDENGEIYEIIKEKIYDLDSKYLKVEKRGNILIYRKVK